MFHIPVEQFVSFFRFFERIFMLKSAFHISEGPIFLDSRILFEYTAICPELCIGLKDEDMKTCVNVIMNAVAAAFLMLSCETVQVDDGRDVRADAVRLEEVAEILSLLPLETAQLNEVYEAVTSSSGNGYDEEYTMKDLFQRPGAGVGDIDVKSSESYQEPLRDLIEDYLYSMQNVKSSSSEKDPEEFLTALMESDVQIYWPFSEEWDGETMPVITYDPEDGSEVNVGYRLCVDDDGFRRVEEVIVDEAMADEVPVWVVNRNSDAGFTTLEMLRREDPEWGEGGGNIIVRPQINPEVKSGESYKVLVLRDFKVNRNYDTWFAGASEFFVKIGYLEDFTAMTEAEMRLYNPMITDFMIVVRRSQVGVPQNFNAVLMTDWSEDIEWCAFQITEDDGGTKTEWSTKAKVFVEGKSYGFEINIPLNSRDDIVWRGRLDYKWFDQLSGAPGSFGDVELVFEVLEY